MKLNIIILIDGIVYEQAAQSREPDNGGVGSMEPYWCFIISLWALVIILLAAGLIWRTAWNRGFECHRHPPGSEPLRSIERAALGILADLKELEEEVQEAIKNSVDGDQWFELVNWERSNKWKHILHGDRRSIRTGL